MGHQFSFNNRLSTLPKKIQLHPLAIAGYVQQQRFDGRDYICKNIIYLNFSVWIN